MPLLGLEPFIHPQDLLSAPVEGREGSWLALHTRPRAEKTLARKLLAGDVPFFLPLYKRQWRNRGRLFCSHLPLFPSYVFLHGDGDARLQALETNLVAQVLTVSDQRQLSDDLRRIFQVVESGLDLTREERLPPGTPVEIIKGPLAGSCGKVLRHGAKLRLVVEVQFLNQGVSVDIESWMLREIPASCL
ncbi:MAG: UpxY family transcription antiterminator [Planctomycetes bacterium]|nr:UpxY family transcription antiterminator [Planctomycetota bacterium]